MIKVGEVCIVQSDAIGLGCKTRFGHRVRKVPFPNVDVRGFGFMNSKRVYFEDEGRAFCKPTLSRSEEVEELKGGDGIKWKFRNMLISNPGVSGRVPEVSE